jgi:hypothetical protein
MRLAVRSARSSTISWLIGIATATVVTSACTSRSASEESDLAEPDIAVVPDVEPATPHGEVKIVDGLLSTKRLPAAGFRALIELLAHRDKSHSRLYDRAIKELVKVACEREDSEVQAVIDGSSIEEIYPVDRLRDAEAAGCGIFFINGRKIRGALFDHGCFAQRLSVVTAPDRGDHVTDKFEKCPSGEPHKNLGRGSNATTLGSASVPSGSTGSATKVIPAAGSGSSNGSATTPMPAAGSGSSAAGSASPSAMRVGPATGG